MTNRYMAPEMVILLKQGLYDANGAEMKEYTNAVDYWSLGVTVFRLLTGDR